MSIPKNHHYVSQVHIKNFFNNNEGKIYVYDKIKQNHFFKTTTKTLFSERFLNTRLNNGIAEHKSLEDDLNTHFEKDFSLHYNEILAFIQHKQLTSEVGDALLYFAKYGIIADMRTPRYKQDFDNTMCNAFSEIFQNSADDIKNEVGFYMENTRFGNILDYSKTADKILDLMGNLIFKIQIPKENDDYFLLTDIAAATSSAKINTYFNPHIEEIAYIGIPLSSKIYIHYHSEKLFPDKKPDSKIVFVTNKIVESINKLNFDYCPNQVACENQEYLKKFIDQNQPR